MKNFLYRFFVSLVRVFTLVAFRIKVTGRENIPEEGAFILCANHTSNWDLPFLFSFCPRFVRFLAKEEIFSWFFIGWLAKIVGAIPIHRGHADMKAMRSALNVLKNGEVLGIFPEGTRMKEEEAANAKAGVALFAYQAKADVLPCYIDIENKSVKAFCRVRINFGEIIKNEDLKIDKKDKESFNTASKTILEKIYAMSGETKR